MCNDPIYLLFAGDYHHPYGGMKDFKGFFPSVKGAEEYALIFKYEWWHTVDKSNMKIVDSKFKGAK